MKDFLKTLLVILTTSSAFLIGFFLGEEKIKSKISNFQEDSDEKR